MTETHVVSALRTKRAEVSGYIRELENKLKRQRANLVHIDATIRVFAPDLKPESIRPKRLYRRTGYFARNELYRRCLNALREANAAPLAASVIVKGAMADKGLNMEDAALVGTITEMVLTSLRRLSRRGAVIKTGTSRDAQWVLVSID
jgi:hypothetical protein